MSGYPKTQVRSVKTTKLKEGGTREKIPRKLGVEERYRRRQKTKRVFGGLARRKKTNNGKNNGLRRGRMSRRIWDDE